MSAQKNKWVGHVQRWVNSPTAMVRELFQAEPDLWQIDVLEAFPHKKRIAMKASKGPGKSTVLAWIIWNFLLTRPNANVVLTSISGDNLKDGLLKELAKWYAKSKLLQTMFTMTSTRIESRSNPKNWFASARTWPRSGNSQEQADSLAGLHEDHVLFVLDEAGGIPDAVMASAEGALASGVESHIVIAGNPTHREGPLFRACTTERNLWHVVEISGDPDDPKRASRVDAQWARDQIQKYGRDNPFVLVNVFGQFPPYSFNALIGDEQVRDAMKRSYRDWELEPYARILGIDVARQGDDMSVICKRHGLQMYNLIRRRNVETGQLGASLANRIFLEFNADAMFIDATGGFGHTWIDALSVLGRSPIGVQFAQRQGIEPAYYNKRAAIYFDLIQWIKNGGALPPEDSDGAPELLKALTNTTYTHKGDALILEDKDDIKAKIGFSPDEADAAALTFAEPVRAQKRSRGVVTNSAVTGPYHPFSDLEKTQGGGYGRGNANGDYNPFSNR